MSAHSDIDVRMKENYESVTNYKLTRRTPVIIRIDGKAFHTLTRGLEAPFDDILMDVMNRTMQYLCSNIQGCRLGFVQSDEISLLLVDYQTFSTHAWFNNELRKIVSISASIATLAFNKEWQNAISEYRARAIYDDYDWDPSEDKRFKVLQRVAERGALFDSRAFNVPREEVTNYFYSRQLDATRNSIESTGQAHFSARQLHNKTCNQIQEMLFQKKGINWNDFSTDKKRGRCCIKKQYKKGSTIRSHWVVDKEIPIFTGDGREYVERFVGEDPVVIEEVHK